ncbi:hypothetical protein B0H67DRAFT_308627 [Lasiosphaeris hirsuta]|uniref:Uncharacterized protein n=1 Tax=Lasiosphaeris hirsuta TaxID=260670 RepID=A0AA40DPH8_9PEZI|nr:hypothetical protein B0H67DRAFT_308627 [Lasiosphaeris hirsuta]
MQSVSHKVVQLFAPVCHAVVSITPVPCIGSMALTAQSIDFHPTLAAAAGQAHERLDRVPRCLMWVDEVSLHRSHRRPNRRGKRSTAMSPTRSPATNNVPAMMLHGSESPVKSQEASRGRLAPLAGGGGEGGGSWQDDAVREREGGVPRLTVAVAPSLRELRMLPRGPDRLFSGKVRHWTWAMGLSARKPDGGRANHAARSRPAPDAARCNGALASKQDWP